MSSRRTRKFVRRIPLRALLSASMAVGCWTTRPTLLVLESADGTRPNCTPGDIFECWTHAYYCAICLFALAAGSSDRIFTSSSHPKISGIIYCSIGGWTERRIISIVKKSILLFWLAVTKSQSNRFQYPVSSYAFSLSRFYDLLILFTRAKFAIVHCTYCQWSKWIGTESQWLMTTECHGIK